MSRSRLGLFLLPLVAIGLVLAGTTPGEAQVAKKDAAKDSSKDKDAAKEKAGMDKDLTRQIVHFTSPDGVELEGSFYKSDKGVDAPCAMLVHRYQSDRSKSDWDALARALQAKGFAVLTFDLRGHGNSKEVKEEFWKNPINSQYVKGGANITKKRLVSYSDFKDKYFPMLVNDLVAARRFLDTKNDGRECNSRSIVVIGAQDGADLGLLWIAHEATRSIRTGATSLLIAGTTQPAIEHVAGAVWLGVTPRTQSSNFQVREWIHRYSAIRDKVPMCFIYGEQDASSARASNALLDAILRPAEGRKDKHKLDVKISPKTSLPGQDLLGKPALRVDEDVVKYVEKLMNDRKSVAWESIEIAQQPFLPVNFNVFNIPLP